MTSRPYSGSRHDYHIPAPNPLHRWGDSVAEAAHRLGCSVSVVYDWIKTGKLSTRRGTGNRQRIPWTEHVEAQCGRRITESGHLNPLAAAPTRPTLTGPHRVGADGHHHCGRPIDQRNSISDENIPIHDGRRGSMKHPSPAIADVA